MITSKLEERGSQSSKFQTDLDRDHVSEPYGIFCSDSMLANLCHKSEPQFLSRYVLYTSKTHTDASLAVASIGRGGSPVQLQRHMPIRLQSPPCLLLCPELSALLASTSVLGFQAFVEVGLQPHIVVFDPPHKLFCEFCRLSLDDRGV